MWEEDFYCYGCCKRKKVSLRVKREGNKSRCTTCTKPLKEQEALGVFSAYSKAYTQSRNSDAKA